MGEENQPRQRRKPAATEQKVEGPAEVPAASARTEQDDLADTLGRLIDERPAPDVSVGSPFPRLLAALMVIAFICFYSLTSYFHGTPAAATKPVPSVNASKPRRNVSVKRDVERLVTLEELALRNGTVKGQAIWLAICGEVFDVTRAPHYYAPPDGGYSFFSGRDGTRAFITGEFNETGLVDDIRGLDPHHMLSLVEWTEFYHKDYTFVGKLAGGSFYDEQGKPKEMFRVLQDGAEEGRERRKQKEDQDNKAPPCDMRWSQAEGGEVWCANGGLPRRAIGDDPITKKEVVSCRCLNDTHYMTGAHTVQVYDGCDPYATRCRTGK